MNMKKTSFIFLISISLLHLTGCLPKKSNKSGTTPTPAPAPIPDNGAVNNSGGNTTPQTPANCTGTTSDGQGDGQPIHQTRMILAGHQTWVPGNYTDPLQSSSMLNMQEAAAIFKSDSRLKVRFKVNSQPFPTKGEEYCYGRLTGQTSDQKTYTKLRFRVSLRDLICNNINAQDPTKCDTSLELGEVYRQQFVEPISVNYCSNPIDIGAIRNATTFGTVIQIDDVKADSTCQVNGTYCPAEKIVRAASCWDITLQIVTDYTQDFKP